MMDISSEIQFQTTRSGGRGGQNVNKVETAVIARFSIVHSASLTEDQKNLLMEKLANRINAEGELLVKSQLHRTQLANREEALKKVQDLIKKALHKKKARITTKPSRQAKEKRIEKKKQQGERKQSRKKFRPGEY